MASQHTGLLLEEGFDVCPGGDVYFVGFGLEVAYTDWFGCWFGACGHNEELEWLDLWRLDVALCYLGTACATDAVDVGRGGGGIARPRTVGSTASEIGGIDGLTDGGEFFFVEIIVPHLLTEAVVEPFVDVMDECYPFFGADEEECCEVGLDEEAALLGLPCQEVVFFESFEDAETRCGITQLLEFLLLGFLLLALLQPFLEYIHSCKCEV